MEHINQIQELILLKGSARITKVQSTFIILRFGPPPNGPTFKIHFKNKYDFNVKQHRSIHSILLQKEHIINLESREECFDVYFHLESELMFPDLQNAIFDAIDSLYNGLRPIKYFMNPYYRSNGIKGNYGLLCWGPYSLIEELNKRIKSGIINLLPHQISKEPGFVLILDNMFVWAKTFNSEQIEPGMAFV